MSGFLYYVPGKKVIEKEDLKNLGLSDLFSDPNFERCVVNGGPDKEDGIIFAKRPEDPEGKMPRVGYFPDRQAWEKAGASNYWTGYEKDARPGPADLMKAKPLEGHSIQLGDDNQWTVPIARKIQTGMALPQALILNEKGELMAEILPRFAAFSKQAEAVFHDFCMAMGGIEKEEKKIKTFREQWDIAVVAISLNYNVTQREISILRLVTTENIKEIIQAIIDVPTLVKMEKGRSAAEVKKKDTSIRDGSHSGDMKGES